MSRVTEKALKEAAASPLVRVRVGRRQRRGWLHVPVPLTFDRPAAAPDGEAYCRPRRCPLRR
ncbi:MAG TPA: hypothetical protein VE888_05870 [Streptosporangiaceae bacterium]|nr:hypothetical protein [Streptosporangiaceae bacterium]